MNAIERVHAIRAHVGLVVCFLDTIVVHVGGLQTSCPIVSVCLRGQPRSSSVEPLLHLQGILMFAILLGLLGL